MTTVACSDCSAVVLVSPETAERLEGLRLSCQHCGGLGHIAVHEGDDGAIARLELAVREPGPLPRPCASGDHIEDLDRPGYCLWCLHPMRRS